MVVDGQLKDGDFLPNEAELMAHFGVSRPTLREAVRVLESERLVEVRRGSRTGARVRVPGPGDRRASRGPAAGAVRRDHRRRAGGPVGHRTDGGPTARRVRHAGGFRRARPDAGRRHPGRLAVGSARRDDRRVSPPARRTVGQRHARDDRGHAARDHRAAHRIRVQGRPPGVQGGLRQADAVLPAS